MWLPENEGAKLLLECGGAAKIEGVLDILIASADCIKGFPDAINAAYLNTQIQLCVAHIARNSVKFVPWKDYKQVTPDLKLIYQAVTEDEILFALDRIAERRDDKHPQVSDQIQTLNKPLLHPN